MVLGLAVTLLLVAISSARRRGTPGSAPAPLVVRCRLASAGPTPRSRGRPGASSCLALGVPAWTIGRWLLHTAGQLEPTNLLADLWATASLASIAGPWWPPWRPPRPRGGRWRAAGHWLGRGRSSASPTWRRRCPASSIALALDHRDDRLRQPLYQTTAMLLAAYVVLFIPRAMVSQRAAIAQAPATSTTWPFPRRRPFARLLRVRLPLRCAGRAPGRARVPRRGRRS